MKCPYCKETIDDDSYFCDQCGKELHFCPECGKPKQGTECPACGADLVSGKVFFAKSGQQEAQPQVEASVAPDVPSVLVGNGWRLPLKVGVFGRTQGIYPEFGTCPYISGRHGEISRNAKGEWGITDLGSHNGTFINGTRLEPNKSYLLKKGQRLKIATINFDIA